MRQVVPFGTRDESVFDDEDTDISTLLAHGLGRVFIPVDIWICQPLIY
jgi:hypothetical protein